MVHRPDRQSSRRTTRTVIKLALSVLNLRVHYCFKQSTGKFILNNVPQSEYRPLLPLCLPPTTPSLLILALTLRPVWTVGNVNNRLSFLGHRWPLVCTSNPLLGVLIDERRRSDKVNPVDTTSLRSNKSTK